MEYPIWAKTIKRAADILWSDEYEDKAKIGYPNRFLSVAQGRPASGGRPFASVRSRNISMTISISLLSGNGF